MIKKAYFIFGLFLLLYLLWPMPSSVSKFSQLPASVKSDLAGDTYQIPNVVAYFSNNYRDEVMLFYKSDFRRLVRNFFGPITINHPPEFSWDVIKKHTDTTYLEELVYPLKGSLYVNGFEPFYSDGEGKFWGATKFGAGGSEWYTKVTMRYFPSSTLARVIVWLGIMVAIALIYQSGKEVIQNG